MGYRRKQNDDGEVVWRRSVGDDYEGPSFQDYVAKYEAQKNNPLSLLMNDYNPEMMSKLYGTAGYIAPKTDSGWGNGGIHGELQSLDDYYRSFLPVNDEGERGGNSFSATPEQLAARAAFEAKYPGMYQLSPNQVNYQNGEIGLKTAGPSVGQYVENPNAVQYDPTYGYITNIGNDAVAGQAGGWNGWLPLSMMVPMLGELSGLTGGLGATGSGVNAGGLDGVLGDSIANYSAGMGNSGMSFFGDILGPLTDSQSWANDLGFLSPDGSIDWAAYDAADPAGLGNLGADVYGVGDGVAPGMFDSWNDFTSTVQNWGVNPQSAVKSLLGGGSSGTNLGSLLGGRSIFDTAVNTAPFLAAINYAKNQDPFDTSKLDSLYSQFNPQASAFEYDQNTATGRRNLNDSLVNRGVMGSSFGNFDINSFNTNREIGRNALINQGVGTAGNLANMILDAQVKGRAVKNDLIGRSLAGLGSALSPKQTIFG